MPKLTSRDYKSTRRSPLELQRYRQFLYGTGVGVAAASVAFLWLGARQHPAEAVGRVPDPHAVLAAAAGSAPGAGNGQVFTYPDMLAKTGVPLHEKEKRVKREPPAGHRAQEAAR